MSKRRRPQNPALETDQNARFAGDLAAQLSRCAALQWVTFIYGIVECAF